jgi:AraC family transcriptional regulator, regulatory protein of adaptative response / DNA-3-methyladenine glycosylase II
MQLRRIDRSTTTEILMSENGERAAPIGVTLCTMKLTDQQYYQAVVTRDRRFDGVFFVGVKSTGIYCRPVCPSRRPLATSCVFFTHAAIAEAAGFRPCLRCRPEIAPSDPLFEPTDDLLRSALERIRNGELEESGTKGLAASLGISERHLRRLMIARLGVSPIQVAQTQRLLLAKQLLTETRLPIIEVAYSSGFSSLRRFNALFRQRYLLTPTSLRKQHGSTEANGACICRLGYRPPFAWNRLLEFCSRRQFSGVELVGSDFYSRTVRVGNRNGWIIVRNRPEHHEVSVEVAPELLPVLVGVLGRVRRLLDLDASPDRINRDLGALAEGEPGLRVPGAYDPFEMAVRAILGQQISIKAASTLAGRLVAKFAEPLSTPVPGLTHLPPAAADLARLNTADLQGIGVTNARANTLLGLARAVAGGSLSLDAPGSLSSAMQQLRRLPGIGEWTAQYFAMRAFRWPDAFPHSDLVVMRTLNARTPNEALRLAERYRPWRAYATMHLWRRSQEPAFRRQASEV